MRPKSVLFALFVWSTVAVLAACGQTVGQAPNQTPNAAPASPAPASNALAEFQKNTPAVIEQYLRDNTVRKVQLGSGSSRLQGWLNTDIEPGDQLVYLDATKPFPFEDGSIHYIFSEHVIEHLTFEEGKAMAAETFRVLAPGGRMRVSTPDMARFIELFDKNPSEDARAYTAGKLAWHEWPKEGNPATIILNLQMSSWGHKFMYDMETLSAILTNAGFREPQEFEENMSNDPVLEGLEERDTGVNARWSAFETMSMEVVKPAETTTSK